jgi:hypothetical protein
LPFSDEGYALVVVNCLEVYYNPASGVGMIDKTGREIIPAKYDVEYDAIPLYGNFAVVSKYGKYGIFNINTGKEITPFKYESIVFFQKGIATAQFHGREYIIDTTGKEINP